MLAAGRIPPGSYEGFRLAVSKAQLAGDEKPADLVVFGGPSRRCSVSELAERVLLLSPDPADPADNAVLQKPFKPAALIQAVRELIN